MQAVAAGLSGCAGNSAACWKMRMASEIRRLGRDRRFPVICEAAKSKRMLLLPAQNRAKAGAFAYSRCMLTSGYASIYENERRRERFHPHR